MKLAVGPTLYDPSDPMGKMFFNILATFADFEADLIRLRTREGMAIARARGTIARQGAQTLRETAAGTLPHSHATGEYSISDLAELFSVSRPTVYRTHSTGASPPLAYDPVRLPESTRVGPLVQVHVEDGLDQRRCGLTQCDPPGGSVIALHLSPLARHKGLTLSKVTPAHGRAEVAATLILAVDWAILNRRCTQGQPGFSRQYPRDTRGAMKISMGRAILAGLPIADGSDDFYGLWPGSR